MNSRRRSEGVSDLRLPVDLHVFCPGRDAWRFSAFAGTMNLLCEEFVMALAHCRNEVPL